MKSNFIDRLMVFLSVVTAASAIILTVWDSKLTIEHNHLSVQPDLNIGWSTIGTATVKKYGLYVYNKGSGPAIITSIKYVTKSGSEIKDMEGLTKELKIAQGCVENFSLGKNGTAVSAGQDQALVRFIHACFPSPSILVLEKGVKETKIIIEYESAYGRKFVASNQ